MQSCHLCLSKLCSSFNFGIASHHYQIFSNDTPSLEGWSGIETHAAELISLEDVSVKSLTCVDKNAAVQK